MNMKVIVLFALVAVVAAELEYYTTGDEHFDMSALFSDQKKLQSFLDCFFDRSPCSELPASYKKNMREAVEQACERCTPNQKYMFWQFLKGLKLWVPYEYINFKFYYDPENKYFEALEREISKYQWPDMFL